MHSSLIQTIFKVTLFQLVFITGTLLFAMDPKLQKLHTDLMKRHPGVKHIEAPQLLKLKSDDVVIFDAREVNEYAVSQLENAIQVDPKIEAQNFLERYQEAISDKTVVFYCSVGVRSSKLAERIEKQLNKQTENELGTDNHLEIYNLLGGVFEWHNNKRPLVSASGKTDLVHPYNRRWSKYIVNKDLISYKSE